MTELHPPTTEPIFEVMSALKDEAPRPGERDDLAARGEELRNMFNRARFGYPGMALGTPQFGVVSYQANRPRLIQFALKFLF